MADGGWSRVWLRGEVTDGGAVADWMNIWRAVHADPTLPQRLGWTSPSIADQRSKHAQMEESEAREVFAKQYGDRPHDRPAFWTDERYSGPNQPVVGVNWYEANAYCGWLTEQMAHLPSQEAKAHVRLPTEAEWEHAARMDRGWVYPWGNRWSTGRANTWEGHVLRSNPVGGIWRGDPGGDARSERQRVGVDGEPVSAVSLPGR